MTAASIIAWRKRLKLRKAQAASLLGVGRNTYARYEAGTSKIPLSVLLACAAIAQGLPPIGQSFAFDLASRQKEKRGE